MLQKGNEVRRVAKEIKPIDVSRIPELLSIAEEVCSTGEPRLLRRDGEDLAIVTPAKRRPKRGKSKADHEAFLASAGSWKGIVDTDRLIDDIYESRRGPSRPPVDL